MKKAIISSIFLLLSTIGSSQVNWSRYSQVFDDKVFGHPDAIGVITLIPQYNDFFKEVYDRQMEGQSLSENSRFIAERPAGVISTSVFSSEPVHFFINGIDSNNAAQYQYRIGTTLNNFLRWRNIVDVADSSKRKMSGFQKIAYIGSFDLARDGEMYVDVRNVLTGRIISTAIVRKLAIAPIILNIYTSNELDIFLKRLSQPDNFRLSSSDIEKWKQSYGDNNLDIITKLPKQLVLKAPENALIFYLKGKITDRHQVEYQLERNGVISVAWKGNDFDNSFIWLKNLTPGSYRIHIRYAFNKAAVLSYPFIISPSWYQTFLFKIGICMLLMTLAILTIVIVRQRSKTFIESEKRRKLQIDRQIISAQLNPHFIFNCLNSIQGLINNGDIFSANMYLANFAKLLRNTLLYSERDGVSLEQELSSIDLYLKLESMRFHFSYQINVVGISNTIEIDIPPFLIQPIVENSVKHGISSLAAQGNITITAQAESGNLLLIVQDNGTGYNVEDKQSGYGLKLTKERLQILNLIFKGKTIASSVDSEINKGTRTTLIFTNWIDEH